MIIPNDTGHPYRLRKFVEYQHKVPSLHYRTLGQYILSSRLTPDDVVVLSWYMSCTYNEITCILLFETLDWKTIKLKDMERYWRENKSVLDFGSARKYAKNMDWFVPLMDSFMGRVKRKPYEWLEGFRKDTPTETYKAIYKEIMSIQYVGRFSADLFMEMICHMSSLGNIDLKVEEPFVLDWKNCSNLTSGLFNIFYEDERADNYDKTKTVSGDDLDWLNEHILIVQKEIQKEYPEQDSNLMSFIGKICSFRNLFKGRRYGGYHHDRQLGVIRRYQKDLPQYRHIWSYALWLRQEMFEYNLLGEFNGWDNIRKERNKLWIKEGRTGVECDC